MSSHDFGDNVEDFFGQVPDLLFISRAGVGRMLHVLFHLHSNVARPWARAGLSGVMELLHLVYPGRKFSYAVFYFPLPGPAVIFLGW